MVAVGKKKEPLPEMPKGYCATCHNQPHIPAPAGGVGRCGDCERGRFLADLDAKRGLKSQVITTPAKMAQEFEGDWN